MIDITQILANLGSSLEPLTRMVTGGAYLIGCFFFYKSIMTLKMYGEMRMFTPVRGNLLGALIFLFVGAVFLYIPTGMHMFINTFYGYGSPLAYEQWIGRSLWGMGDFAVVIVRLIQFVGVVWFVKGLIMLAYSTKPTPPGQPKGIATGFAYVLGGIFAVNFIGTANMISATIDHLP